MGSDPIPEPVLNDWLLEADIDLPDLELENRYASRDRLNLLDWAHWYTRVRPSLTDKQVAHIWKALDKIDPLAIEEIEVEE